MPIAETLAAVYLRRRGLDTSLFDLQALHFVPRLWHWPTRSTWPAMLALIRGHDGHDLSVHETFLSVDGLSKAPVERPRLYRKGLPISGGGVWIGKPDPASEFIVAERIETTLSAMALYDVAAGCAALSAAGVRQLVLPPQARRVRIFADNDELGQGLDAAREAWRRWRAEGRTVAACMAETTGEDANDIVMKRARTA